MVTVSGTVFRPDARGMRGGRYELILSRAATFNGESVSRRQTFPISETGGVVISVQGNDELVPGDTVYYALLFDARGDLILEKSWYLDSMIGTYDLGDL